MLGGGVDYPADGVPAFGPVVAEDDHVFQSGDPGEAPVADGDARRPAGDHGDGGHLGGQRGQGGYGVGVGPRLVRVRDDLGEGAVEVQCDHGSAGCAEQGIESLASGCGDGHRQVVRMAPHTDDPNGPAG